MQIGVVKGQVVSTKKAQRLDGIKILIVQPLDIITFEETGRAVASLDTVGAGEGEVVMLVNGSSARMTDTMADKPTDSIIVAIIDSVDIQGGRVFDKALGRTIKQESKRVVQESEAIIMPQEKTEEQKPSQTKPQSTSKQKSAMRSQKYGKRKK